jgi:hypothetical protein
VLTRDPNFIGYDLTDRLDFTIGREKVKPLRRIASGPKQDSTQQEEETEREVRTIPTHSRLFIDDNTVFEHLFLGEGQRNLSQLKERKLIHAVESEQLFKTVCQNVKAIGMRVNEDKTQMLCVNAALNSEVKSYIKIGGKRILSEDSLKIVGFTLSNKPTVEEHVKTMKRKAASKAWIIRHLKKANIPQKTLIGVYSSSIRPHLEYAGVVFDGLITENQSESLERIQRN